MRIEPFDANLDAVPCRNDRAQADLERRDVVVEELCLPGPGPVGRRPNVISTEAKQRVGLDVRKGDSKACRAEAPRRRQRAVVHERVAVVAQNKATGIKRELREKLEAGAQTRVVAGCKALPNVAIRTEGSVLREVSEATLQAERGGKWLGAHRLRIGCAVRLRPRAPKGREGPHASK